MAMHTLRHVRQQSSGMLAGKQAGSWADRQRVSVVSLLKFSLYLYPSRTPPPLVPLPLLPT